MDDNTPKGSQKDLFKMIIFKNDIFIFISSLIYNN
jgi:hypothetical protein